jgi:hypothetical protein
VSFIKSLVKEVSLRNQFINNTTHSYEQLLDKIIPEDQVDSLKDGAFYGKFSTDDPCEDTCGQSKLPFRSYVRIQTHLKFHPLTSAARWPITSQRLRKKEMGLVC